MPTAQLITCKFGKFFLSLQRVLHQSCLLRLGCTWSLQLALVQLCGSPSSDYTFLLYRSLWLCVHQHKIIIYYHMCLRLQHPPEITPGPSCCGAAPLCTMFITSYHNLLFADNLFCLLARKIGKGKRRVRLEFTKSTEVRLNNFWTSSYGMKRQI